LLITKLWNNDIQFSLKFAMFPWKLLHLDEGFCLSCSKAAQVAYKNAQITNWDQLKTYFGLCELEHESEASYSDCESSHSDVGEEEWVKEEAVL
jgi:hypothetical protein